MKRRSLIVSLSIIFSVSLIAYLSALLSIGVDIHRTQLKKEAALLSHEVVAFKHWFSDTYSPKSHAIATKEFDKIRSKTINQNSFRVVGIRASDNQEAFDSKSLSSFEKDKNLEYVEAFEGGTYKYAQPLKITQGCLKCHGNYKIGEIAGIIAVDIPEAGVLPHIERKSILTYITVIAVLLSLIFTFIWFESGILKPLGAIESAIKDVKAGNYETRISLSGGDEFGNIAENFNLTMEKLSSLIQTDEERKQMQQNIIKFLDILSSSSEGDLRQKAEVTPDIFGSLGDAFNLMVDGLSDLIEKVKGSVEEVNSESIKMMNVLKDLENGASSQMLQVKKATDSVNQSAKSASKITDKTKTAQEISEKAEVAINTGSKAVGSSIEGVRLIRLTIQAINKRMKYLSERLMEIVTISHLINEIANRTNILAINASIEATRAGEQGKGFVVISDEIRSLAEKASKSTKQITDIINAVQTESVLVTKHLEEETKYVELGTKMALDTEAAFRDIEKTIKDTSVIISEISTSAEGQKKLTSDVVMSMEEVQIISLQVLKLVQDFTEISKSLTETSNVMISSVARFKLPEKENIKNQ